MQEGGITKLVTGLKTNRSRKLECNHFLPVAILGFPLTSDSYSKQGSSMPKIVNINIAGMNLNIMNAVNRAYLWTVEVDGCLCSCRIVVFCPTAPIIADLFCNSDGYTIEDQMM
jgi:hypothetical protein